MNENVMDTIVSKIFTILMSSSLLVPGFYFLLYATKNRDLMGLYKVLVYSISFYVPMLILFFLYVIFYTGTKYFVEEEYCKAISAYIFGFFFIISTIALTLTIMGLDIPYNI